MAYYLQSSSSTTGHIQLPINIAQGIGGGATRISWDIEFECKRTGNDFVPCGRASDSDLLVFLKADDSFELRVRNQTFNTTNATLGGIDLNEFHVYRLEHREVNTTYETTLFVDDVQRAVYTLDGPDQYDSIFSYLFALGGGTRHGAIKYWKYTDNITATNSCHYDCNASGGTGTVVPETTGNYVDGTQQGTWPGDDSEWVSYTTTSISITGDLTPNAAFTIDYDGYTAIPVSPATLTDSQGNAITVAVTITDTDTAGVHSGTASGTMPALPGAGSATGLLFGTVTVELST